MARYETIETNPTALRHIASDISSYTDCQICTLQDFLNIVTSVEDEITTQAYKEAIERVRYWLQRMEDLKRQSDEFAAYLRDRAEKIELMEKNNSF